jgi:putative ABC transport system permease protein
METVLQEIRYALRRLLKAPGFSAIAVLTLAIGIGMNTAIFSVVHAVFLRELPFQDADHLVRIYSENRSRNISPGPISVPKYWYYREAQTVFSELAADTFDTAGGYILTGLGDPEYINGSAVTANYFQLLGVKPIFGRLFMAQEETNADVAVISQRFWSKRLAHDPNVLGRSITLNGVPTTIVGVIPNMPVAWFGREWDVWTAKPFALPGASQDALMRGLSFLRVIGRLKPGVTLEQARAAMLNVHAGYRAENGEKRDSSWTPSLVPVPADVTSQLRPAFSTIAIATALVWFIASSNVANLLLVRFSARNREIALRVALGASRHGIVRLFVLESILLSAIAGAIGVCLALWLLPVVPLIAGRNVPMEIGGSIDSSILVFGTVLSLVTGAAVGAYPAIQSSRVHLLDTLKNSGRRIGSGASQQRLRRLLIALQVSLALVVLAAAGLLITSYVRLSKQKSGFEPDNVWFGITTLPPARYPDDASRARFASNLHNDLQSTLGLESVAISEAMPLTGAWQKTPLARDKGVPMNERPMAFYHNISSGFLRTLGIGLVAGRDFTDTDNSKSAPVVLISQSTANKLFTAENAVGQHIYFGPADGVGTAAEIVGVVGDIRFLDLDKPDEFEIYLPFAQQPKTFVAVAVRGRMPANVIANAVRTALRKIDSELPIIAPNTIANTLKLSLGRQRLTTILLGVFGGVAMLLATTGIYGAVAYTVEQRTGEIGLRMALGAQTRDVLRLIVNQGMRPVLIGVGIGIIAAFGLGRLIASQLYQVSAHNPALLAGATVLLAAVALIACLLPARRAALIDPVQALRTE